MADDQNTAVSLHKYVHLLFSFDSYANVNTNGSNCNNGCNVGVPLGANIKLLVSGGAILTAILLSASQWPPALYNIGHTSLTQRKLDLDESTDALVKILKKC